MRTLNSKALAIGIAAIAASAASGSSGCSSKKPTEIVPGALTQLQVPKDLAGIQVEVSVSGADKFCQGYAVANGEVELPSTLGVVSGAAGETLRITLRGYDVNDSQDMNNCNHLQVDDKNADTNNGPAPRVLRQSIVSYVDQQTLFLPMPLSFACYDVDCTSSGQDSTCKGGTCSDGNVPAGSLAAFDPSLVDGTGDCFDPTVCLAATAPADVIDASSCLFGVPSAGADAATSKGYNVRITYTDVSFAKDPGTGATLPSSSTPLETQVLDTDAIEGYTIPDSSQPLQFQLAPGLCALEKEYLNQSGLQPNASGPAYHTVSNVDVAVGCPAKSPLLPFCAGQQHGNVSNGSPSLIACGTAVPVQSTPSALYVVADDSGSMGTAFGSTGYATAMNLSFAFPVFNHTYVAFDFLSGKSGECPASAAGGTVTGYTSPQVAFGLAPDVQKQVAGILDAWAAPDTPGAANGLYLQGAMQPKSGAYQALSSFATRLGDAGIAQSLNVAGLVLMVNRIPTVATPDGGAGDSGSGDGGAVDAGPTGYASTGTECALNGAADVQSALVAEANAAFAQNLSTYFVVFNDDLSDGGNVLTFYNGVASAATPGAVTIVDATVPNGSAVIASFAQKLAGVASCLYDLPSGVDTTATLTFTVPAGTPGLNTTSEPESFPVTFDNTCNAANQNAATTNGWNVDNGRIRVCGKACTNIQVTILAAASEAFPAQADGGTDGGSGIGDGGLAPVPAIPVDVTMPCPASTGP